MPYQPISMPDPGPPGIYEARMAQLARERQTNQDRWAMITQQGQDKRAQADLQLRQQQEARVASEHRQDRAIDAQDRQAKLHEYVRQLHEAGMPSAARDFAALHGLSVSQSANPEAAPGPAPSPPVAPQEPKPTEFAGPVLTPDAARENAMRAFAERTHGGAGQDNGPEYFAQATAEGDQAAQQAEGMGTDLRRYNREARAYREAPQTMPARQAEYEQQLAAHDQQQHRFDEAAAHPTFTYSGGGQSFTVDPTEKLLAARAKNREGAELLLSALGADPRLAPYAGSAAAMAQSGLDDPKNIFANVNAEAKADATARAEAAKQAHAKEFSPQAFEQAKELARIGASGRVQAATAGKQESANDRAFTLLDRRAKSLRDSTQFNKLITGDKTVRGLMANIADGTVPLQHGDAQIQLARYFRQAQPTEGEMHQLYANLGGTMDKWNQFVARMTNGDLSPEQIRQVRIAAGAVAKEDSEDKRRFVEVARRYLGPKSGLDMMPDQAQNLFEGMAAELGLDPAELPPLYETEGGVTIGTGKKPATAPRAPKQEPHGGGEDDAAFLRRMGIK